MNKRQKRALLSAFLILMCVWPVLGQTENQKLCDRLQVELIGSNPATAIKKPDGQWQVFWPGKNRFCPTISLLLKYKQAELINGKILLNYENPNEVVESLGSSLTSYLKTKQDPIEELNAFLLANRDKYEVSRRVKDQASVFTVKFPTDRDWEIILAALLNNDQAVYNDGVIRIKSTTSGLARSKAFSRPGQVLRTVAVQQGIAIEKQRDDIQEIKGGLVYLDKTLETLQGQLNQLKAAKLPLPGWLIATIVGMLTAIAGLAIWIADHHRQLNELKQKKEAPQTISIPINGSVKPEEKISNGKPKPKGFREIMSDLARQRRDEDDKLLPVPNRDYLEPPTTEHENA